MAGGGGKSLPDFHRHVCRSENEQLVMITEQGFLTKHYNFSLHSPQNNTQKLKNTPNITSTNRDNYIK